MEIEIKARRLMFSDMEETTEIGGEVDLGIQRHEQNTLTVEKTNKNRTLIKALNVNNFVQQHNY